MPTLSAVTPALLDAATCDLPLSTIEAAAALLGVDPVRLLEALLGGDAREMDGAIEP
jgi:hypothetical protein